ncbi:MAG TPA: amidohydrolase family protein, partial [Burkholderiaceae bacterium]|nr:amidohydrolase family protein [Burkholderiaceae bacterium]
PTAAEQRLADPQILSMLASLDAVPTDQLSPRAKRRIAELQEPPKTALQNLKVVHEAGVTIVMGTDAGNIGTVHGPSVFREMAMMQQAGLTPLQVLRAATINGARAAHREPAAGKIERGAPADLVLLDADPTVDIANASRIARVFRNGFMFDPDQLIASIR